MQDIDNYKRNVKKRTELYSKLIKLIVNSNNQELIDTFSEYQKYELICENLSDNMINGLTTKFNDTFK